ncbi:RNA-binding protein 20 isoform X2 [Kryptolebias marmoratus]|nr:RNA-binding protein 20 isoform X2 [Kryptolebias marmoratus]
MNMSQPLLNQLRTSAMVGNPQGAFPTGVIGFPSSNSAMGALVGGGFNQNPGNVGLNHPSEVGTKVQQGGKSGSAYPPETDRRLQYNLAAGASNDGQYTKNMSNAGFQRDLYGQDVSGQPSGFIAKEQMSVCNSTAHNEQWKGHANLPQTGNVNVVTSPSTVWTKAVQPMWSRTEVYNPEEPTSDPKVNCNLGIPSFGSSGTQGFGNYQSLHGSEDTLSSGTRTLQPYQVNDYYGVTPDQLPHQCSICDKKVYNLKDWDQHVKGKLHLQNQTFYTNESSAAASAGAGQYAAGRPSDGGLNPGGSNPIVCSATSQDVSSGTNTSYLPAAAAAMKTYPVSDTMFASQQPESKPFPPRKATIGRVVHICNLPEGSCTENDVINLGLPFGKVTNYILMRSTHQAFLEMAYVEAAQAMVQYYQLTPAMINNQKLLIRMSKRYKELQLKKPGKDVQSIIQDIASQRERDQMQELEHYLPERPRSRSPISRSLSPHSHSPSFTSCSSAHSPQGAPYRGPDRGSNGLSPHRSSWDCSSHLRRIEDERDRDDLWRNGGGVDDDRPNGRTADRWKTYQKHSGHLSLRSADERGGSDVMRSSRDRHPRDSPHGFSSYRNMDDSFYMEQVYKSDKELRTSHQRNNSKPKRRDGGDYPVRSRHSEFELSEELPCRLPEDKRTSSPGRDRSRKTSRRHTPAEKRTRETATESTECLPKEKPVSPQQSHKPAEDCNKDKNIEKKLESNEDTDEECWYPKNMEELVTVDEVGEDESIIEPDLLELEEFSSCPKEVVAEESKVKQESPSASTLEVQKTSEEKSEREKSCGDVGGQASTPPTEKAENGGAAPSGEKRKMNPVIPELPANNIGDFPSEEFKAALEETCLGDSSVANNQPSDEPMENHICLSEDIKNQEERPVMETIHNGAQQKDYTLRKEIEASSPSLEQDKAVSEHSIPLGVEFIVPQAGFFCKLCGLFYTSEETAKSTHCRSTVHYRNLQKYLSQLAEDSLSGVITSAQ